MPSPAQQHRMRVLAARPAAHAAAGTVEYGASARLHSLMARKLDDDRRRLKEIQSTERKIDVKREILPDYDDYVAGVLAGNAGVQDDVLGYVMVWRIDVGDFAGALPIARYVLEHDLKLPDRFERTVATYVAEAPAMQALKAYAAEQPFDVDVLREVVELTKPPHDMPDQVRAKLLFALGRHLRATEPAEALDLLVRAVELHDGVGAKKDIEQLRAQLKKTTNTPPAGGT
jgi:hypothetical protein